MLEEDDILEDAPVSEEGSESGRFDKLLGSDAREYKLSGMFKDWYLDSPCRGGCCMPCTTWTTASTPRSPT